MQKILLFVLVIFIVNTVSAAVYTQASINKLVTDAQALKAAAAGKAGVSSQADQTAQTLAAADKVQVNTEETTLTADIAAQLLTQNSYNAQLTATTGAQTLADSKKVLLATAQTNVDANKVVVDALEARKTAMAYTSTVLEANAGTFLSAVNAAGTAISGLQTKMNAWKAVIDGKVSAIGANSADDMNTKKTTQENALTALGPGGDTAVCKTSLLNALTTAATAYLAAGVKHSSQAASLTALNTILTTLSTDLAAKVTALNSKQLAVQSATNNLAYSLSSGTSVLGKIQVIINNEIKKVNDALTPAQALTISLATALTSANSAVTSSGSAATTSEQLLTTEMTALTSAVSKTATTQSLYDTRYTAWMASQKASFVTANTNAVNQAAVKMATDMVTEDLALQIRVNVALKNDVTAASAALQVVETKAASVTAAAAAKLKTVTQAATAALAAGQLKITAAVTAEVALQKKADNTQGIAWNKSLVGDATAAKTACNVAVKKAKDANKSSTKLNFSVLSLIAGLLIMTMN